ncbi:MAG: hypothetical protein IJB35_00610 [Oscillospiraceae bacterium]|nr:hypothetical protein [Oscillospiraceae bacterium]
MDRKDSSKIPPFSPEQVKQLLSTPEAQQLIALLNRDGGKGLQQAAEEFRKGNVTEAQEVLKPLVQNQEADALLKKFGGK